MVADSEQTDTCLTKRKGNIKIFVRFESSFEEENAGTVRKIGNLCLIQVTFS